MTTLVMNGKRRKALVSVMSGMNGKRRASALVTEPRAAVYTYSPWIANPALQSQSSYHTRLGIQQSNHM